MNQHIPSTRPTDADHYPLLNGPDLEKVVDEIRTWYVEERLRLLSAMTTPYPYRSKPITPEEQFSYYKTLTPAQWQQMRMALMRMFQGHPNASAMVDEELLTYQRRMEAIAQKLSTGQPMPEETPL